MVKKLLPVIIAVLIIGGGAFYGGMKYGQSTRPNFALQNLGGQQSSMVGGARLRQGFGGQGFISGEIISKDDPAKDGAGKSITVKLPEGSSKIIFYSGSTEISKSVSGISNDLETGKTVVVNGTANSDGSITAQSIQIRPAPANQ